MGKDGRTRKRVFFVRKTTHVPYAHQEGPLLPTIPEGFSPPWDPCPSVCEGGVHCFETLPWQRFSAMRHVFAAMAPFLDHHFLFLIRFPCRMGLFSPGPLVPVHVSVYVRVPRTLFCPVFHGARPVPSTTAVGRFLPLSTCSPFKTPCKGPCTFVCLVLGFAQFSMARVPFRPRWVSAIFFPVSTYSPFTGPCKGLCTWFCLVFHGARPVPSTTLSRVSFNMFFVMTSHV